MRRLVERGGNEIGERGGEGDGQIGRARFGRQSKTHVADTGHGSGVSEQLDPYGNATGSLGVHG